MTKRTFMITGAFTNKGCPTKFTKAARYTGSTPSGATKKAFTELCRVKKIRGVATYYMTMRETTRESSHREFTYLLHRNKLDKPLVRFEGTDKEFTIRYTNSIKKGTVPKRGLCKGKSRGRMKKKSALQRGGTNTTKSDELDKTERCMVCMDRCPNIQMLTCGHWICKVCFVRLEKKQCPKCRGDITENVEFLPFVECSMEREKEMEEANANLVETNQNNKKQLSELKDAKEKLLQERNTLAKEKDTEKEKKKLYKKKLIECRHNVEELSNEYVEISKSTKKRRKR